LVRIDRFHHSFFAFASKPDQVAFLSTDFVLESCDSFENPLESSLTVVHSTSLKLQTSLLRSCLSNSYAQNVFALKLEMKPEVCLEMVGEWILEVGWHSWPRRKLCSDTKHDVSSRD